MDVGVKLSLHKLLEVDDISGTIKLIGRLDFNWRNPVLAWDPAQYDGLDEVRLGHGASIWRPRLALLNFASTPWVSHSPDGGHNSPAIVYADGSVYDSVPVALEAWCKFDATELPFDTQTCKIKLGSADHPCCEHGAPRSAADQQRDCPVRLVPMPAFDAHDGHAINGSFAALDRASFSPHASWELEGIRSDWSPAARCAVADGPIPVLHRDEIERPVTPAEAAFTLELRRWPTRVVLHSLVPLGVLALALALTAWIDPKEHATGRTLLPLVGLLGTAWLCQGLLALAPPSRAASYLDVICLLALGFSTLQLLGGILVVRLCGEFATQREKLYGRRVETFLRQLNPRLLGFGLLFAAGRPWLLDGLRSSLNLGYNAPVDLVIFCVGVGVFYLYAYCCPSCCDLRTYLPLGDADAKSGGGGDAAGALASSSAGGAAGGAAHALEDSPMYFHASHITIVTPEIMANQSYVSDASWQPNGASAAGAHAGIPPGAKQAPPIVVPPPPVIAKQQSSLGQPPPPRPPPLRHEAAPPYPPVAPQVQRSQSAAAPSSRSDTAPYVTTAAGEAPDPAAASASASASASSSSSVFTRSETVPLPSLALPGMSPSPGSASFGLKGAGHAYGGPEAHWTPRTRLRPESSTPTAGRASATGAAASAYNFKL